MRWDDRAGDCLPIAANAYLSRGPELPGLIQPGLRRELAHRRISMSRMEPSDSMDKVLVTGAAGLWDANAWRLWQARLERAHALPAHG